MRLHPDVLTTGEAAQICGVSRRKIIDCFDNGLLRGFKVPGSSHRRILRDELVRFMEEHGVIYNKCEKTS